VGAGAGSEHNSNGSDAVDGRTAVTQVELPAALWQHPALLPSALRSSLSESSALSPAAHGAHVTPRSALHLLTDDTANALAPVLDKLKPMCSLCDEVHKVRNLALGEYHTGTVRTADFQGSYRLLHALTSSMGRLLAAVFVEASTGTRGRRKVSVGHLFHQVLLSCMLCFISSARHVEMHLAAQRAWRAVH
jgi:hypothetical protein